MITPPPHSRKWGDDGARAIEGAGEVKGQGVVPIGVVDLGDVLEGGGAAAAGIGDEHIDAAPGVESVLDERVDVSGAGDVGGHGEGAPVPSADLLGRLLDLFRGAGGAGDVGAGVGEGERHLLTQPAPGAGHNRGFSPHGDLFEQHGPHLSPRRAHICGRPRVARPSVEGRAPVS